MASPALLDVAAQYFSNSPAPQLEFAGASNKGQRKRDSKRSLDLRETVIVGETQVEGKMANSVFKMQRQLFARSERVKGIDFHPVEPWILTTLYSGMFTRPCTFWTQGMELDWRRAEKEEEVDGWARRNWNRNNADAGVNRSCLYLVLRDAGTLIRLQGSELPSTSIIPSNRGHAFLTSSMH